MLLWLVDTPQSLHSQRKHNSIGTSIRGYTGENGLVLTYFVELFTRSNLKLPEDAAAAKDLIKVRSLLFPFKAPCNSVQLNDSPGDCSSGGSPGRHEGHLWACKLHGLVIPNPPWSLILTLHCTSSNMDNDDSPAVLQILWEEAWQA
jgi:hypothetical protein